MTTVTHRLWGTLCSHPVYLYTLTNSLGNFVEITDYGAAITSLVLQTPQKPVDVVLGLRTPEEYGMSDAHFGACIGRVCNRIGRAVFTLNGQTFHLTANDGENHLHGGIKGFDRHFFHIEPIPGGIRASRRSPDGEENYPGNLDVSVDYIFDDQNRLSLIYRALSDKDTIINLTNHTYFNLSGENFGNVYSHLLTIDSDYITENDANCLPTGRLLPVKNTPFDFSRPKAIGRDIHQNQEQLVYCHGYDHNFCLNGQGMRKAASVFSPETHISMDVYTDLPGMQFYTANFLNGPIGKSQTPYGPRSGFCLETQYYPNAMACPDFPSIILKQGSSYFSRTTYAFAVTQERQR